MRQPLIINIIRAHQKLIFSASLAAKVEKNSRDKNSVVHEGLWGKMIGKRYFVQN